MNDQEQLMQLIEQLIQAAQSDPEAKQALIQYVALGVQAAQKQLAQQLALQPVMAKKGTKLLKKSCGGKKLVLGDKITKAKCGCKQLKRMGGKIVEVDCNNKIVK